jgi:dGTPase
MVRDQIGLMVNDVLEHTAREASGLCSVAEVRAAARQLAGFSPAMAAQERRLKSFMYERLYFHPEQVSAAERARDVVAQLFAAYAQDATLMPKDWQARLPAHEPQRSRVIADFIAGMSDRFAIQATGQIYGQQPMGLINV